MDPLQRLLIKDACHGLISRYCHLCDARDHQAFAALFIEDGVWSRPVGTFRGREAIRKIMDERPANAQTRHVMGSVQVDVIDDDHAMGLSYATVYRDVAYRGKGPARLGAPEMLVDYQDRFVRVQGQWLIASRHTTMVFQAA